MKKTQMIIKIGRGVLRLMINMKKCSKCKLVKNLELFYKNIKGPGGYQTQCITCAKDHSKSYYIKNKEKLKNYGKKYYNDNKNSISKRHAKYYLNNKESILEHCKNYYKNNKEVCIKRGVKRSKERRKNDVIFKLKLNIRRRINNFLKNKSKTTEKIIGCSYLELKIYLESQFQQGMSWDNYGLYGWHIDHIIPLASAKTEEKLYKLCHYKNLQPLWAIDNIKKGKRV